MHLLESSQDSQKLHKSRAALSYCVSDWQDSREERTFRVWLLSLLRNEVHIQNLAESLRDGYVLLRVLDLESLRWAGDGTLVDIWTTSQPKVGATRSLAFI